MLKTPVTVNSTIGSRAVTGMGTASLTHQLIIHSPPAITAPALGDNTEDSKKIKVNRNSRGPVTKPVLERENFTELLKIEAFEIKLPGFHYPHFRAIYLFHATANYI